MAHLLEQKIGMLRRRARRMAAVYGLSVAAAAVLGTIVALGGIDYLLRWQDRGARIVASLLVLAVLGWTAYQFLVPALFARWRDVDLALRVERHFPRLQDRLLSAVEFLRTAEDDALAGSAAMRRAAIAQTAAETEPLDFSAVLDARPATRAALLLAAICLVAAICLLLAPVASQIAIARLVGPLGNTPWPRMTHLKIDSLVERVARGQDFEIRVIDSEDVPLPPDVRVHYRLQQSEGAIVEQTERMRFAGRAAVARRETVGRPFAYRVEGGDDHSMPWRQVEVVDAPAIESLSIRLVPPTYTGWPPVPSDRHIRALVGTRVELAAKATRRLVSATLCLESGRKIPAVLDAEGLSLSVGTSQVPLMVEKSGSYWFELIDREGLRGGSDDRWEIEAVPDRPPTVAILYPTANLFVTPQALLPIRVSATDDLAVKEVALAFRVADSASEQSLPLFTGPMFVVPPHSFVVPPLGGKDGVEVKSLPPAGGTTNVAATKIIDYLWDLTPLKLRPGAQVTFYASAGDYRPQTGKSEPRRLSIVTADELQERIAEREKLIVAELERALGMQRRCRAQVESLRGRLAGSARFEQEDVDRLQAAEHAQREVGQLLVSRGEGIPMHVLGLLADVEINRLDDSGLGRRMEMLLDDLDRLQREHLPPLGRELTAAVKTGQVDREGQGGAAAPARAAASLAAAATEQDAIIALLQEWLGRLAQGRSDHRFVRQLNQLLHDEEDVARRTADVGRRTLARDLRELAPPDAADLEATAARQLTVALGLDRLLQEMDDAGPRLSASDPPAAVAAADAVAEARRLALSEQMRTTGQRIERNQIGQAAADQKQIVTNLQRVLDVLTGRRQADDVSSKKSATTSVPGHAPSVPPRRQTHRPAINPNAADGQKPGREPGVPGHSAAGPHRMDAEHLRTLMGRLWGELPPHQRQQLLQPPIEQSPPKYEAMIEQYYRRLAEEP